MFKLLVQVYAPIYRIEAFPGNSVIKNLPTGKEMAPHSSTLAWKIPWTEEPGGLQSTGLQRVRHD